MRRTIARPGPSYPMNQLSVATPNETSGPSEAYKALTGRVGRKSGKIPADLLVRHVMSIVPAEEWPIRLDAMDALLRRLESSRKDELKVESRPGNDRLLGIYRTRRKGSVARPYRTLIRGIDPIHVRCDCPDFLRNSLGVCKHSFAVIEWVFARAGTLKRLLVEQQRLGIVPELIWDPIRPLTGPGDWMERIQWIGLDGRSHGKLPASGAFQRFRPSVDGRWVLAKTYPDDLAKRQQIVEELLRIVPSIRDGIRPDPSLRALLLHERTGLRRVIEKAVWPSEQRSVFKKLKRPLYPYQREGVRRFLEVGRLLLADDMGLGKTAQAIACCEILWRTERVRRGLIIAPAALKPQWAREWQHFSDLPIEVVDGAPAERQALFAATKQGFLIMNYEQLLRDLEFVRGWAPDLVVLDEAQRIKNWATKTALSVKGLDPTYRLVLTGTPMENRIEELASIVEWVDDMALEPKWRLPSLHAVRADGHREVIGVRHLETIRQRLRPHMIRRVRQEVLEQLPPRTDTRVPVAMTDAQIEEHDALNQPIAQLVQISLKRPLTQAEFLRLMSLLTTQRIISNGLAQLQFTDVWPSIRDRRPEDSVIQGLSSPKLMELRQLVRQLLEQGRKIVLFSQWRRMLHLAHWSISDLLAERGLRAGFFTGEEGQRRRTQNIVEFHDDPDLCVLFASDAGGVGLNLQRAANCVINLELPWNPAVLEQRIGRIYRIGQKLPIDVYNLVNEVGIESRIADLVGSKQAFFKGLFDSDSDTVKFDQASGFLSRVQKMYERELVEAPAIGGAVDVEVIDPTDLGIEDDVSDPYGELIETADEARDALEPPPVLSLPAPAATVSSSGTMSEPPREQIAALSEAEAAPILGALPAPGEVRRLFSQLQVRRGEGGKVIIEAPPEAACTLSALFEGMAALLQSAAGSADE